MKRDCLRRSLLCVWRVRSCLSERRAWCIAIWRWDNRWHVHNSRLPFTYLLTWHRGAVVQICIKKMFPVERLRSLVVQHPATLVIHVLLSNICMTLRPSLYKLYPPTSMTNQSRLPSDLGEVCSAMIPLCKINQSLFRLISFCSWPSSSSFSTMEWWVLYLSPRLFPFHSVTICGSNPNRTIAAAFDWISWYTNTVVNFDDLEDSVRSVAFLKVFFSFLY